MHDKHTKDTRPAKFIPGRIIFGVALLACSTLALVCSDAWEASPTYSGRYGGYGVELPAVGYAVGVIVAVGLIFYGIKDFRNRKDQ